MIFRIRAWLHRNDKGYCRRCGKKLTDQEIKFYGLNCNKCEEKYMRELWNDDVKKDGWR